MAVEARFREGEGLSGRTWRQRDLFFTPDIGQMTDCCRAPAAQRAGVKSGVCFPVVINGQVAGTMDFFALQTLNPSRERLDALRGVGDVVSAAFGRILAAREQAEAAADAAAVIKVMETEGVNLPPSEWTVDRMKKTRYLMAGSVDDVRKGMDKLVEDGNPEYVAWLGDQGLLPLEVCKQQMRIFGEQILPHYSS